ncbi:hypothetical protein LCGC14_2236640, partial [marine sediment metagenome]
GIFHWSKAKQLHDSSGSQATKNTLDFLTSGLDVAAKQLITKIGTNDDDIEDVLTVMPDVAHFHLGGDEAWTFGTHPDTKAYIEANGKGALYLHHVEPLLDLLNERGVRPILWHDMMISWDDQAVQRLAEKADLCVWGYREHPDHTSGHHSSRVIQRFADCGVTMWGGTAYKGAAGVDADLTDFELHTVNASGWAEVSARYGMKGVFATAWSRYSTHNVHCETIEACLDSLVNVAVILHDGQGPAGGEDRCVEALAELGQKERFEAVRAAMAKLTGARDLAWRQIRLLRQVVVMAELDERRRSGGPLVRGLRSLKGAVAQADAAAEDACRAYDGLIPSIWVQRYLAERTQPLREELDLLAGRVRELDPAGYGATVG